MKSIDFIREHKNKDTPLVSLTAYTTPMAQSLNPHVDFLLVGDSVGTVLYGMDTTTGVTLDMMIAHGQAVMRAKPDVPVIVDMPFGTYEEDTQHALNNAKRIMDETGADGVKLEGGVSMRVQIEKIVKAGIPVLGHIGLQPQSVEKEGGYKIKGKTETQVEGLIQDAQSIEEAGAFAFVLEGTIDEAADQITKAVNIPSIGIGASAACDGQILVTEDLLGLLHSRPPKFVQQYANMKGDIDWAIKTFAGDVRARRFPSEEHLYKKAS